MNKPQCRICGREMVLLDPDQQRWYCYKDDETFFAKEQIWGVRDAVIEALPPDLASKLVRYYKALYIDGYANAGTSTGIVYLFSDKIQLRFDKLQVDLSYDSIEVLAVMAEREITALRTFVIGPVLAAAFKQQTKVLMIGFRDKLGLLQLPSFKMHELEIEDCYNKILARRTPSSP